MLCCCFVCNYSRKKKKKGRKSSEEKNAGKEENKMGMTAPPTDTFRLVSPSRLAVVMWQVPSARSDDSSTKSAGKVSSLATRTMSPTCVGRKKCVTICRVLNKTQFQMQAKWFILWMLVTKRASLLWQCLIPKDTCSSFSVQTPNSHSIGGL